MLFSWHLHVRQYNNSSMINKYHNWNIAFLNNWLCNNDEKLTKNDVSNSGTMLMIIFKMMNPFKHLEYVQTI